MSHIPFRGLEILHQSLTSRAAICLIPFLGVV